MHQQVKVLQAVLLAALLHAAAAGAPPAWYSCTCGSKSGDPSPPLVAPCVCPSTNAPGGLSRSETPQFILLTHDDSLLPSTYAAFTDVLDGRRSANGCVAAATFFTTRKNTDCALLRKLHASGSEVASHTVNHKEMNGYSREQVAAEVVGARAKLAADCRIPEDHIVGFRQPYLQSSPTVREVLHSAGFQYDSTLIEEQRASLSAGFADRVWPHTLQDGIPMNVDWFSPTQTASPTERWPGMFEVPIWPLPLAGCAPGASCLWSMDYLTWPAGPANVSTFDILKENFDSAYNGNRSPFPIFIHTPWLLPRVADLQRFADYALSKPDVYMVTMRQLLAWMQHPLPRSRLTPRALGCGSPGGAGGTRTAPSPSPPPSPPPSPSPLPSPSPSPSPAAAPTYSPSPAPAPAAGTSPPPPAARVETKSTAPAPAPAPQPVLPASSASLRHTLVAGTLACVALLLLL